MIIEGTRRIAEYVGRSKSTVLRWIEKEGFPAGVSPKGRWMTTENLVDSWILSRRPIKRTDKAGHNDGT